METIDIESIHPSLRHLYTRQPARVIRTDGGALVRVFDTCMPADAQERSARVAEAWRVADGIARRSAVRGA